MSNENQIELAKAQFTGFMHGRSGYNFESLAEEMGLTVSEWEQIKQDKIPVIPSSMKIELDQYFKEQENE